MIDKRFGEICFVFLLMVLLFVSSRSFVLSTLMLFGALCAF